VIDTPQEAGWWQASDGKWHPPSSIRVARTLGFEEQSDRNQPGDAGDQLGDAREIAVGEELQGEVGAKHSIAFSEGRAAYQFTIGG
jgi:hypothetical protein